MPEENPLPLSVICPISLSISSYFAPISYFQCCNHVVSPTKRVSTLIGVRGEFFRGAIDNMSAILNPLVMSLPSRGGGQNNLITYQHKLSNSVMSIYLRARFIVLRSFCQRILSKEAFSFKFLDASLKAFLMRLASYSSNTALVTFPAVSVGSSILIFGPRQTLEYMILSKVVPVRIEMMSAH